MTDIIISVIMPIIVIAGLGALVDYLKPIETSGLSRVVIYLLSPALAFSALANATISGQEIISLMVGFWLASILITVVGWGLCVLFRLDRLTTSAVLLSVSLMNIGNYGIPFNELAFGQAGLERALLITVAAGLWVYTGGTFIASWGRAPVRESIKNVFLMPTPYAALLGFAVNVDYLPAVDVVMTFTDILGSAAVPLMLVILGIQVGRVTQQGRYGLIVSVSILRLIGGAVSGFLVVSLMGLEGLTAQVLITETAMPTAVIATLLATEFHSDAELTSGITLVSTVLSIITLSGLLVLMR
ncbi:AEC family transporter [Anaerolineales bacterium HSG6]|nr:AEC family transporter [Anaerolineales bacterium HSG6]MDM8531651.1 AEC family transporter [Anaerolineales bacterium HSG25]